MCPTTSCPAVHSGTEAKLGPPTYSFARHFLNRWLATLLCGGWLACSSSIATAQTGTVQYVYDALGRLVRVTAPNGDFAIYTYDAVGNLLSIERSSAVTIISFTPTSGPTATTVTITGTGFSATPSANNVAFNGTVATVTSATTTQLITTVPVGATTGNITVTTPTGSATSSSPFTVAAAPTITNLSATIGAPGSVVTIDGTNFDPVLANNVARFNTNLAVLTGGSTSSLTTTVPQNGTSGRVTVTTLGGTATSGVDFFVPPSPYAAGDVLVTGRTSIGGSFTAGITTANKIGLIVFDAVAGQRISIKVTVTSGSFGCGYVFRVIKPNASTLAQVSTTCGATHLLEPIFFPDTGTYTIFLDPAGTSAGTATVNVYEVTDVTTSIVPSGSAVTAPLTTPGQNARLPFNGNSTQRVSAKVVMNSGSFGCAYGLKILKPDESVVAQATTTCNATNFLEPAALLVTGPYTLLIDPAAANTGTATVNLYNVVDVTDPITPNGGALPVSLSTPGQNALLPFTGVSGHQVTVSVAVTSGSFGCSWQLRVLKPDASMLGQVTSTCGPNLTLGPLTLPSSGTYTVVVDPLAHNTGTANVTLTDVGLSSGVGQVIFHSQLPGGRK